MNKYWRQNCQSACKGPLFAKGMVRAGSSLILLKLMSPSAVEAAVMPQSPKLHWTQYWPFSNLALGKRDAESSPMPKYSGENLTSIESAEQLMEAHPSLRVQEPEASSKLQHSVEGHAFAARINFKSGHCLVDFISLFFSELTCRFGESQNTWKDLHSEGPVLPEDWSSAPPPFLI